jgi:hypothetical protein
MLSLKRYGTNTWTVGTPGKQGATGSNGTTASQISVTFSNGGSVLDVFTSPQVVYGVGSKTITGWYLTGSDGSGTAVSGSISIEIWKRAYSTSVIPLVADKITASAPCAISSATNASSTTLTGWTTSISAGDQFVFKITGTATNFKYATLTLTLN